MKALWTALEKFDQVRFNTKKKVDALLGRPDFQTRMETIVKDVHLPEKVIQFDA
jgi:hypothetical protein